jgi:carbon-monoxide dehydrogenase small subunit
MFAEEHALQCGYCTPGMLMCATDLLARNPAPSETLIKETLAGNLCRCTGYAPIVRAIQRASGQEPRRSHVH